MKKLSFVAAILMVAFSSRSVLAAQNYPDRHAYMVNTCPHVEITSFSFENQDRGRDARFVENFAWKSTAAQPIVAFEIVVLKYDAFNERMIGSRVAIQGTDSANWSPLPPGKSSSDGTIGFRTEDVFTGIAYVRRVRLSEGTVWRADESRLLPELKKVAPNISNPGSLAPDAKPATKE